MREVWRLPSNSRRNRGNQNGRIQLLPTVGKRALREMPKIGPSIAFFGSTYGHGRIDSPLHKYYTFQRLLLHFSDPTCPRLFYRKISENFGAGEKIGNSVEDKTRRTKGRKSERESCTRILLERISILSEEAQSVKARISPKIRDGTLEKRHFSESVSFRHQEAASASWLLPYCQIICSWVARGASIFRPQA